MLLQGLQNFMREFLVSYKYHTDVLQANTSHSFTSVILLCRGFFFSEEQRRLKSISSKPSLAYATRIFAKYIRSYFLIELLNSGFKSVVHCFCLYQKHVERQRARLAPLSFSHNSVLSPTGCNSGSEPLLRAFVTHGISTAQRIPCCKVTLGLGIQFRCSSGSHEKYLFESRC